MGSALANSLKQYPHLVAFEDIISSRFDEIDLNVLMVYLIDVVPEVALQFLADQFDCLGVKGWKYADTVEKKRVVTMDGVVMEDVREVHLYSYNDYHDKEESHIEIMQTKMDKDQGTMVNTRTMASADGVKVTVENPEEDVKSLANCLFGRKVV